MNEEQRLVQKRLRVLEHAKKTGNVRKTCRYFGIGRSSFYYQPGGESEFNLHLMRLIDEQYLRTPWYGSRQMKRHLRRSNYRPIPFRESETVSYA
jgi:putative transposase